MRYYPNEWDTRSLEDTNLGDFVHDESVKPARESWYTSLTDGISSFFDGVFTVGTKVRNWALDPFGVGGPLEFSRPRSSGARKISAPRQPTYLDDADSPEDLGFLRVVQKPQTWLILAAVAGVIYLAAKK